MCPLRLEIHTYLNMQHACSEVTCGRLGVAKDRKMSLVEATFAPVSAPPPPPPLLLPPLAMQVLHRLFTLTKQPFSLKMVSTYQRNPLLVTPEMFPSSSSIACQDLLPSSFLSCISHNRGCSGDAANRDQCSELPPPSPCNWSNGFKMINVVGSLSCLFGFARTRMGFNGIAHQMLSDPCEWLHPGGRSEEINPVMSSVQTSVTWIPPGTRQDRQIN